MSRDEIIAIAKEAGFRAGNIALSAGGSVPFIAPTHATSCLVELERFAALVEAKARAEEREECAAECEGLSHRSRWVRAGINGVPMEPCQYAAAIRARGTPDDLTQLTERGAKAWAGVDAQKLRDGDWP